MRLNSLGRNLAWIVASSLSVTVLTVAPLAAQVYTSFARFLDMTEAELSTIQFKLTARGYYKSIKPVIFATPEHLPHFDMSLFIPFRRAGFRYYTDDIPETDALSPFSAPVPTLSALLDSIALLPAVTDGGVDSSGTVSFMIVNALPDSTFGFESILAYDNAKSLFLALRAVLSAERDARMVLERWGCNLWLRPSTPATDVTASVAIRLVGIRRDRGSDTFVGTLQVRNTSTGPLSPPLSIVLHEAAELELAEYDGVTCVTNPSGWAYVDCPLSGPLGPGQSVERAIRFRNPGLVPIETQPRAFGGPGER